MWRPLEGSFRFPKHWWSAANSMGSAAALTRETKHEVLVCQSHLYSWFKLPLHSPCLLPLSFVPSQTELWRQACFLCAAHRALKMGILHRRSWESFLTPDGWAQRETRESRSPLSQIWRLSGYRTELEIKMLVQARLIFSNGNVNYLEEHWI